MKTKRKIFSKDSLYYFFALNIVAIFVLYIVLLFVIDNEDNFSVKTLENNWTVELNHEELDRQPGKNLNAYIFPNMKTGDVLTLKKTLDSMDVVRPRLVFDTWNVITLVYVDGQMIYESGKEYYVKTQMMGGRRHVVPLPENYVGKTLRIDLYATKNNPMPNMQIGVFAEKDTRIFWFARPFILICLAALIIYIGLIIMFLGYKYSRNSVLLGLFFFELGTYILCRAKAIDIIVHNPDVYNKVEYGALYLVPFTVALFIYKYVMRIESRKIHVFYYFFVIECYAFIVSSFVLNYLDKLNLSNTLPLYFVQVVLLGILIFLYFKYTPSPSKTPWLKYYKYASVIFMSGSFISIITYLLRSNIAISDLLDLYKWYDFILPAFMVVTIVFILIGMYRFIENLNYSKTKKEFYDRLAHIDGLTTVENRLSFEEEFKKIDNEYAGKNYVLLAFDLNDLKLTNDTIGHISGDNMIKGFADALRLSITRNSHVYRMGGDEFLIICYDVGNYKSILRQIEENVIKFNESNDIIQISYAHGVAFKSEAPEKEEVLHLADSRMYARKAEMKAMKKIGLKVIS